MIGASLYITACTARNRFRVRLQRLREPRYLLGGIVGVAYVYFSVFARRNGRAAAARRAGRVARIPPPLAAMATAGPALGGIVLLAITALTWILPGNSNLLSFSDAEIQFLFPAPVPRRQLLIHRMLRSQLGLLFGSVVIGVMTPSIDGFARLRVSIATWLILVTAKVYFAGVSLSRAKLASRQARALRVAWTPIVVLATAVAIVVIALAHSFTVAMPSSPVELFTRIRDVAVQPVVRLVLWPFVAVARPVFSEWPMPYLTSLALAVGVLAVTAVWVLQSDQAFEEAAAAAAEHRATEVKQQRASYRVRGDGWTLLPVGRPEGAFAWKAAMQTVRLVDRRAALRVVALVFALTVLSVSMGRGNGFATIVGFFATIGTGMAVFFAPQVLRIDMRQDLGHLELLKTWPVAPAAVVRGQLLLPGALITACAWGLLSIALAMSGVTFTRLGWPFRISLAAGAAAGVRAAHDSQRRRLDVPRLGAARHGPSARAGRARPAADHARRHVAAADRRRAPGGHRRRHRLVRAALGDRQRGDRSRRVGRNSGRGDRSVVGDGSVGAGLRPHRYPGGRTSGMRAGS